ncbi:MAG: tetratricopeptide repeat protein [Thermoanaerobaculia bacterium]
MRLGLHLGRACAILAALAVASPGTGAPAKRSAPPAVEALLGRAETAIGARDWAQAEKLVRQAVARSPKSARAHSDLAIVLTLSGKPGREAVSHAETAARLAPTEVAYIVRYGTTLEAAGRLALARDQLRKALALRPEDRQILMLLADCSARMHDEETVPLLKKVIAVWPENRKARVDLADYLWDSGENAEGDKVMEDAIRESPRDPGLRLHFGRSLLKRLQFLSAIEQLDKVRELSRVDASFFVAFGGAYWESQQTEKAREAFSAAVALDPHFFPARLELGRLLLWTDKPAEAADALREAVRLKEDSAPAQWNLGRALQASGDLPGAEKAFRRAVALAPATSRFHYSLGIALRLLNRPGEADAEFEQFKKSQEAEQRATYESSSRRVELNGAVNALRHGSFEEALSRFQSLPESVPMLEGQAEALSRLGRHREAIEALERASALAPEDNEVRAQIASEYAEEKESR